VNKQLKAKWIAALRSGEIKQAKGSLLKSNGSMCCLGVLGRILGIADAGLLAEDISLGATAKDSALRPLDKCGLSLSVRAELADKNDMGKSFAEIADWIEKTL
jgi:hypothetical protein